MELTNQGERYLGVSDFCNVVCGANTHDQVRAQSVGDGEDDDGSDSDWDGVER